MSHHAWISVRRTGVVMNLRWWVEHDTVHYSITRESNQLFHFTVIGMLVHVDEHIVAGVIGVLKCMIGLGTSFFRWCWTMMSLPQHNGFTRVLPTAPATLKVAFTSQRNFFCKWKFNEGKFRYAKLTTTTTYHNSKAHLLCHHNQRQCRTPIRSSDTDPVYFSGISPAHYCTCPFADLPESILSTTNRRCWHARVDCPPVLWVQLRIRFESLATLGRCESASVAIVSHRCRQFLMEPMTMIPVHFVVQ